LLLTAKELAAGVDISTSGPVANDPATLKLHDAILRKANQFAQYRVSVHKRSPEPELDEGFRLLHESDLALADGAFKIAYRLPSRFDITVKFEDEFEAQKSKPKTKGPGPRGLRQPPRGRRRR
jgi:hypothetical protein